MMRDKRKHKRFSLKALDANGRMIRATKVEIINISLGGLSLRADRRLNIGSGYVIILGNKTKAIPLKGVITWSVLSGITTGPHGETAVLYTAGMEFRDFLPEKKSHLLEFMGRYSSEEALSLAQ